MAADIKTAGGQRVTLERDEDTEYALTIYKSADEPLRGSEWVTLQPDEMLRLAEALREAAAEEPPT